MRLRPHRAGQGELGLLARGVAADLTVHAHLLIDAELLHVPADLALRKRSHLIPHGRQSQVAGARKAFHTQRPQLVHGLKGVLLWVLHSLPLNLVHQLARLGAPRQDLANLLPVLSMQSRFFPSAHPLFFVPRLYQVLLRLVVPATFEAVAKVLEGLKLECSAHRVHVVLRNERQPQVLVLPHFPNLALVLGGIQLAAEQAEQRGLAGTIHTHHGHPAGQRQPTSHALDDLTLGAWILEEDFAALHHRLGLIGDALELARDREGELDFRHLWRVDDHIFSPVLAVLALLAFRPRCRGRPLFVRRDVAHEHFLGVVVGNGIGLFEGIEVAFVVDQLLVLVLHNVCAHRIQEVRIVGNHHQCTGLRLQQVLAQPLDGVHVQVIRGLVQQKNVSFLHHDARQQQAHSPTSREVRYRFLLHVLWEADLK
mmetsp:Transcript_110277/g.351513  ORF Transcript_110277/g.351513 Transcript_110277/m.351513 type:complete len:425 (+) Transcript_110277:259-1533(+)